MKNYIISHWRGEQGLLRSCFLNGFVFFILFDIALGVLGAVITVPMFLIFHGQSASHNLSNDIVFGFEVVSLPSTFIYMVWSCVGIFRCGLRNLKDRANAIGMRIGGGAALLYVAYIAYSTAHAVIDLVPHILAGPNT